MNKLTYILKPGVSLTVLVNGKPTTINSSHANFNAAVTALKNKDYTSLVNCLDVPGTISKYTFGQVSVKDNEVYYGQMVLHNAACGKVLEYIKEGFDCKPLLAFLDRLYTKNPSKKSCEQFWEFVDRYQLPIDEDGFVYMCKVIRNDWLDKYTGEIDNSVGKVVEMPRNQVSDENTGNFCSHTGLHVGSLESYVLGYYGSGDDRVIVCKVAPEDVCAVPVDHNFAKVRVCKYEVVNYLGTVDELKSKTQEAVFTNNSIKTRSQIAAEPKPVAKTPNYYNIRDNNGKFAKKVRKFKYNNRLFNHSVTGYDYWIECSNGTTEFVYSNGDRKKSILTLDECLGYVKTGHWLEF